MTSLFILKGDKIEKYNIWFSLINIENFVKVKLLEEFKTTEKIFYAKKEEFYKINLHYKYVNEIKKEKINKVELEKKMLSVNKIVPIFITDEKYPEKLKNIDNPPFCIYCKGNINLLKETSIGIIGSRNASENGKKMQDFFLKNYLKNM